VDKKHHVPPIPVTVKIINTSQSCCKQRGLRLYVGISFSVGIAVAKAA